MLLEAEGRTAALALDASAAASPLSGCRALIVFLNAGTTALPAVAVAVRQCKAAGAKVLVVYEKDARHGAILDPSGAFNFRTAIADFPAVRLYCS